MEVDLALDELLLVALDLALQVSDGFFLLLALPLELVVFLVLELDYQATLVVDPGLAEEVFLEMLVLVAQVDHIQAEVLVVFSEAGVLFLLEDEIALQGHELHLEVSSGFKCFGEGSVELLHLV